MNLFLYAENGNYTRCDGNDYRGCVNITVNGRTCQNWLSMEPHQHDRVPIHFPNQGLGDHNFCRNSDYEGVKAWCYTTDPDVRWELCDIGNPDNTNCTSDPPLDPSQEGRCVKARNYTI